MEFPDTISGASEAQAFKWKSCSYLDFELVTQRRSGPNATHSNTHKLLRMEMPVKKMQPSTTYGDPRGRRSGHLSDVANLLRIKCLHYISDGPGVRTQQYFEKPRTSSLKSGPTSPPVSYSTHTNSTTDQQMNCKGTCASVSWH